MGTAQQETQVVDYTNEYHTILADHVENLQAAGEEYTDTEAEAWAWEVLLNRYPEYSQLPDDYS